MRGGIRRRYLAGKRRIVKNRTVLQLKMQVGVRRATLWLAIYNAVWCEGGISGLTDETNPVARGRRCTVLDVNLREMSIQRKGTCPARSAVINDDNVSHAVIVFVLRTRKIAATHVESDDSPPTAATTTVPMSATISIPLWNSPAVTAPYSP